MNKTEYASIQLRVAQLHADAETSKAVRRKLLRKLCTDLNFKADTWELADNHKLLVDLAVSRVAYGTLTPKQKKFASRLLTY